MASRAQEQYSDDDIERAMATVARVIELYGDAYWPILERLEAELEERRAKSARLTKHLSRFRQRKQAAGSGMHRLNIHDRRSISSA